MAQGFNFLGPVLHMVTGRLSSFALLPTCALPSPCRIELAKLSFKSEAMRESSGRAGLPSSPNTHGVAEIRSGPAGKVSSATLATFSAERETLNK